MTGEILPTLRKTLGNFLGMLPILMAMLLLISLLLTLFPDAISASLFGHGTVADTVLGATLGGIAIGQPMISYVLGGELMGAGVGLVAVTALVVSWVSVGVIHLPAEAVMAGTRFAVIRNALAFLAAIVVGLLVWLTMGVLG